MTRSACVLTCSRRPGTSAERRFRVPSLRPLSIQLQQQPPRSSRSFLPNSPTPPRLLRDRARLPLHHPPARAMGSEAEVTRADFPDGFVFGVATSAYQVPTPSSRPPHPHRTPLLAGARLLDRSCTRCSASLLGIAVLTSEIVIVFHCLGSVVTAAVSSSVIAAGLSLLHFLISVTTHKSPVWINSVSFGPPGLV
jgi:hypothetical protein